MNPNDIPYDDTTCVRCGTRLPEEVIPGTLQDEGYCGERCKSPEGWINNIFDLLKEVEPREVYSAKEASSIIGRRLYKATECGICFSSTHEYVVVLGYAEGANTECPPHILNFPFHANDFWKAVDMANQEGIELFEWTNSGEV